MAIHAPPRKSLTTVVNIKHEAYDVYIGRAMPGLVESLFHNPISLEPGTSREECLEKLRAIWARKPDLVERMKKELLGRRIGCFCAPRLCHGHLIVELIEGIPIEEQRRPPESPQLGLF